MLKHGFSLKTCDGGDGDGGNDGYDDGVAPQEPSHPSKWYSAYKRCLRALDNDSAARHGIVWRTGTTGTTAADGDDGAADGCGGRCGGAVVRGRLRTLTLCARPHSMSGRSKKVH